MELMEGWAEIVNATMSQSLTLQLVAYRTRRLDARCVSSTAHYRSSPDLRIHLLPVFRPLFVTSTRHQYRGTQGSRKSPHRACSIGLIGQLTWRRTGVAGVAGVLLAHLTSSLLS